MRHQEDQLFSKPRRQKQAVKYLLKLKNMKNLKQLTVLGLFAVALSGCNTGGETTDNLESFFPEDTFMVYELNQTSESQSKNVDAIFRNFSEDPRDFLLKEAPLIPTVSYEEDIQPFLGDNYRVLFGISSDIEIDDTEPPMQFAANISDTEAFEKLLEKTGEDAERSDYKGYNTFINESDSVYLAYSDNVAVMANTKEGMTDAVDRSSTDENLANSESYKSFLSRIGEERIGSIYISVENLADSIEEKSSPEEKEFLTLLGLQGFDYEGYSIKAEENGFRVDLEVSGESELLNKLIKSDFTSYLAEKMPGKNLIGYTESSGMDVALELYLDAFGALEGIEEGVPDIESSFSEATGLDLREDLFSFMDKNYAMSMQSQPGVLPGLTIMIDANSNLESAKKFDDYLDQQISGALTFASFALESDELLKKETVEVAGAELNGVKFDITNASDEELDALGIPPFLDLDIAAIYYGLTGDGHYVITTYADFPEEYGVDTVSNNEEYNEALSSIERGNGGDFYFSPKATFEWIDRFSAIMALTGVDTTEYDQISDIVKHFKYIVGSAEVSETEMTGDMFISVE